MTGTDGILRAAWFIEAAFERRPFAPPPGVDDYFQPFTFTSGVRLIEGKSHLAAGIRRATRVRDRAGGAVRPADLFRERRSGRRGRLRRLRPRRAGGRRLRLLQLGLDVKGKIVLSLRDLPEDVTPERRQELALYAGDRYKAKLAADRGAAGFLLVIGPSSPSGGELIRFRESHRGSAIPIPAASVTQAAADRLLAPRRRRSPRSRSRSTAERSTRTPGRPRACGASRG